VKADLRSFLRRLALAALSLPAVAVMTGCHHHAQVAYQPPPPPVAKKKSSSTTTATNHKTPAKPSAAMPQPAPPVHADNLKGKPTLVETGMASWYGAGFNKHKAADGSTYDQNAMTAAHRTLPLGSLVRVTNLATEQQVVVRITDRGPFVRGRVMDLSEGAAKAVGLYRMGVAKIKLEAYAPQAAAASGNWCVQTGAFENEKDALDLKAALIKRYKTARVLEFKGPTGYWVRVDPAGHQKADAAAIQEWIGKPDDKSDAFLVRID